MIFFPVSRATLPAKYSSGMKITLSVLSELTTATALPEVQQMSDSAFTSAYVLMYVTTGTPGNLAFRLRTSSAVILDASEQPAFSEGTRTFLVGFKIFAVSAMNFTPQNTMMSLSV